MNRKLLLLNMFLLISLLAFSQTDVFDNKMSLSLPNDFRSLSKNEIDKKFPISNKPNNVFLKPDGSVILTLTLAPDQQSFQDIIKQKDFLLSSIKEREKGVDIVSKQLKINGHDFLVISFSSLTSGREKYTLMFLTILSNKVLVGTINCAISIKQEWEPKMNEIVQSILIK